MPGKVYSYTPLPKQREFHESNALLRLFQGGFGSGKTLAGVWEAIDVSMAYPNNYGIIARKTYRELEDSTKKTFFDVCPPELIKDYRARDDRVTFVNGSTILFRSLDDPQKFRSVNLGWFYIDEVSEVEDEDLPTMLIGRLRLAHVPWRGGWFTSNPSHQEHWTFKWFVERAAVNPDRYCLILATSYENPYLPPEYVKSLEEEYSPQWVRRYLRGEFGFLSAGTAVYPSFNEDLHVTDDLPYLPDRKVFRAWDFGFHHPAVLFSQIGPDFTWHLLYEKMGSFTLLEKFADEVLAESAMRFPEATFIDVCDPAGDQRSDKSNRTSVQILRDKGVQVSFRRHPKKRLIELIEKRLGMVRKAKDGTVEPLVRILRKGCPVLIEGFRGGYAWPKAKDGRMYRESPMEDGWFEHLQDCAQYTAGAIYLGGAAGSPLQITTPSWRFA